MPRFFWLALLVPLVPGILTFVALMQDLTELAIGSLAAFAITAIVASIYGGVTLGIKLGQGPGLRTLLSLVLSVVLAAIYTGVGFGTCIMVLSAFY